MPYLRKNSVCPLTSTRWWRGFQYSSTLIILHKLHIVKTISRNFKRQLAVRERTYNHFSIRPLNRKSPDYFLNAFPYGQHIIDKPARIVDKFRFFNGLNISFQYIRCRNLIYAFLQILTQKHIICRFISNTP